MLKLSEQIKLLPCLGNVLVVPTNMKKEFENQIQTLTSQIQESTMDIFTLRNSPFAPEWLKNNRKNSGQWFILEQGRALSTIRFNMDGTPFKDEDGKYTPVSAGHGELIHLFDKIADEFPSAECLHIRNIDNVIGTSNDRSDELNVPAEAFRIVRDCIEYLRAKIEDLLFSENKCEISLRIHDKISLQVLDYLSQFIDNNLAQEGLKICYDNKNNFNGIPFQAFHKIIGNLFHWQPLSPSLNEIESWEQTLTWMEQPISIFGVVRKEVADIGGGPIFATLPDGTKIKYIATNSFRSRFQAPIVGWVGNMPKELESQFEIDKKEHYQKTIVKPISRVWEAIGWLGPKEEFQIKPKGKKMKNFVE